MQRTTSDELDARMKRLIQQGFILIPLGKGADGKEPLLRDWNVKRLGWDAFHRIMTKAGSTMYGIRLDDMVVLDIDVHDDALVAQLEARFGPAGVSVRTPRGSHLYYRQGGVDIASLRGEYSSVDVKGGPGHYMVGAGSVRPCGGQYVPSGGELEETPLTVLHDRQGSPTKSRPRSPIPRNVGALVAEGHRHNYLLQEAVKLVAACETASELVDNLLYVRDENCAVPMTLDEKEVQKLGAWAFRKNKAGQLFASTGGSFVVPRHFAKVLRGDADALALYVLVLEQHGHQTNKTFGLRYEPMKRDGLTGLSERAFDRAVKKLVEVGAISIAANHQVGKLHRQYRLGFPAP